MKLDFITELWQQIHFKDLFDILAVSIVIYQLMKILHGTRSMQMVLGIVLLGVISWIGTTYELYSINWLLENFFDSFIIIVVILFQEEIRTALISFTNRQAIFKQFKKDDLDEEINEIVESVWFLGREKIGAIVALENINGLGNYLETGMMLNSNIHRDLIFSIFQEKSALHDGAVIIQKNKIAAAGCFLPLSKNPDLERHLGTRHRAGLGLSEATDAIAIVVSEESGEVKVCFNGKFYEMKDQFTLRRYISFLWGTGEEVEDLLPKRMENVESE